MSHGIFQYLGSLPGLFLQVIVNTDHWLAGLYAWMAQRMNIISYNVLVTCQKGR